MPDDTEDSRLAPQSVSDYGLRDATIQTNRILREILSELQKLNERINVLAEKETRTSTAGKVTSATTIPFNSVVARS